MATARRAPLAGTGTTVAGVADGGDTVQVTVPAGAVAELHARWPPLGLAVATEAVAEPVRTLAVRVDGDAVHATVDGAAAVGGWERVESELAVFAAERLHGLVAVHAAVIARRGRVLLVPGASGSGKSTLCLAAAAAGLAVLSDEYALVDPATGLVRGWRRPVRLRRAGGGVDRVDLTVDSPPLPVGAVALVTHDPAAGTAIGPAAASDAAVGLLANTVCARSRPDEALDAALAVARGATCVSGTRGDAPGALGALIALLDG